MASKEAAILRLLAGAGNQEKDTSDNNNDIGSDEHRAPFNTASATNSLSLLTSRIGNFLEQAKNAPTDQMDIEIDEEVLEEEDTDDEETDDSDNDGLEFNPETMRFYRNPNHLQQQKQKMMVEAPSSKRRKVDAGESVSKGNPVMVEVVAEKNGNDDDDDDDDDAQDDSASTSSSDIDIVTFSSDDDDDDGIDLSKLSEEKKKKLTALFSGKLMQQQQQQQQQNKISAPKLVDAPIPKKGTKKQQQTQNKKDLLKFENDNDNENEKQNDNDDDEYEEEEPFDPSDPLRGKYIQMNLIAGVIQEDRKKLQQQRNGDIVLPTPKELVFEKKKRKKNQKKMSQLVKALVSTE